MPVREELVGSAGGRYSEGPLNYGQKWRCELKMNEFVPTLPPDEYTVRILFHNDAWLATLHNLDGLVYSQSAPIKLSVRLR